METIGSKKISLNGCACLCGGCRCICILPSYMHDIPGDRALDSHATSTMQHDQQKH